MDAPLVLFEMGTWPDRTSWSRALAVVGTRRCSAQGALWAQEVARDWSMVGGRVVSGLARGVDMAAHRATEPGQAVAVLTCGLDAIHPMIHRDEAMRMVEDGGLLLSEHPPRRGSSVGCSRRATESPQGFVPPQSLSKALRA